MEDVIDELLSEFSDVVFFSRADLDRHIENPRWEEWQKVHDWRNYVPDAVGDHWEELPRVARAICIMMAQIQASREVWD